MSRRLDLSSAVAKWYWARHHAHLLESEIAAWGNFKRDAPVRFRPEPQPKKKYVAFWVESIKAMPPEWPLQLGDIISNYRAALDHVAWQLVQAGKPPSKDGALKSVQFPFCDTNRKAFLHLCRTLRLPGVSERRCLKLSPLQPYTRRVKRRAFRVSPHPFLVLPDLSNKDKHRDLTLILNRPQTWHARATFPYPPKIQPLRPGEPFEPNTEAARVWVPAPDYRRVRVEFEVTTAVCLAEWGPVVSTLQRIDQFVWMVMQLYGAVKEWWGHPAMGGEWPHLDHFPGRLQRDGFGWTDYDFG